MFRVEVAGPVMLMIKWLSVLQVAAGMKAALEIEIYAIAVGVQGGRGVGTISHNLHITTETDTISLPITANILASHLHASSSLFAVHCNS
jgi:hypothetical protein